MTFWKTPSFKALQKAWYERLEAEGFSDAEELIGGEPVLKQNAEHVYRRTKDDLTRENKEAYYHFVSQRFHDTIFTCDVERLILSMHSEGKKIVQIYNELEERGSRRCRKTILVKIRTYEMMWGIREYTPRQLNRKVS